jgi:hypothetical protein
MEMDADMDGPSMDQRQYSHAPPDDGRKQLYVVPLLNHPKTGIAKPSQVMGGWFQPRSSTRSLFVGIALTNLLCYRDLVFIQDCTGSQGSYITSSTKNIEEISRAIFESGKLVYPDDLRLGLIAFRDHPPQDHTYITKNFGFSSGACGVMNHRLVNGS